MTQLTFSFISLLAMLALPRFGSCSWLGSAKNSRTLIQSLSLASRVRGGDIGKKKYRVVQVQVIHRHGDRTPISPLRDEEFWKTTLIKPELQEKISEGTKVVRRPEGNSHSAKGTGPFGKLSHLGLLQMVQVGNSLREDLYCPNPDSAGCKRDKDGIFCDPYIWGKSRPLTARDIRVFCTDFPRTVQSVQGLLVGFFPDGLDDTVEIDCRHTSWMIPDPQPRRSKEQEVLEQELAERPHMLERERDMHPLAVRCTDALRPLLGQGAFGLSFGVDASDGDNEKTLSWVQLAEITCCLAVRDRLPPGITDDDKDALSSYLAWRWFESLRHPRLAYLAMHIFCHNIIHQMKHINEVPPLTIYSAHDSTLIGLLSAFRLEQPTKWPEYGSYLKVVLLEKSAFDDDDGGEKEFVVRFYLNGSLLRTLWHGKLREEIQLGELSHYISTEGAVKAA